MVKKEVFLFLDCDRFFALIATQFIKSSIARLGTSIKFSIITRPENFNIFDYSAIEYELFDYSWESFMILNRRIFSEVIFLETNNEFVNSFIHEICAEKQNYEFGFHEDSKITFENVFSFSKRELCNRPIESLYFERISYPIDVLHNALKSNMKYLIGINIGENETVTKKIRIQFLIDLMKKLSIIYDCKFVLFSTKGNDLRKEMLFRTFDKTMLVDLGNLIDKKQRFLIQAIDLCDLLISSNGYMLQLANVIGTKTIGLFARNFPCIINLCDNMTVFISKFWENKDNSCIFECDPSTECEIINNSQTGVNCFSEFNIEEISDAVLPIITN